MKNCFVCIFYILFCMDGDAQNLESIVRFADSLAVTGNYHMAANEYQRAFFFGGNERKYQMGNKVGDCYFALKDYKLARSFYDSAIHYTAHADFRTNCEFQKVLCYMMEEDFGYALLKLNNLEVDSSIHSQRKKNLYQGICLFGQGQYDDSHRYFLNSILGTDTLKRIQLEELFESSKKLKRPRSSTAMMMSIVVPGSGQIYSGEIKDGVNSFLLLGGLAYLGTSSAVVNPVIIIPFFFKYYMGGILNAKQAAEMKRKEKQYDFYTNLMVYNQGFSDTSSINTLFLPESNTEDYSTYLKNSESEASAIISFSFLFYKEFISSQDVDACVFHPSCSVYTIEAIEKNGAIIGLLDGFDRLLRCHLFVDEGDYHFNPEIMKYDDPH